MLNGQGPFTTLEEELFNNKYNTILQKDEDEAWLLRPAREEQGENGEDQYKTKQS